MTSKLHRSRNRHTFKRCETHLSAELDGQITAIQIANPHALVALARHAPVSAAREAQGALTTLETGFSEHRIGIIGAAYAAAFHMMRTDGAFRQFIKDPGWTGLSHPPKNTMHAHNNMLRHVMRYVFRAEGENARRRVRVYAGMLQSRFQKGFKPEGVITLIESQGIEGLRAEAVEQRRLAQGTDPSRHYLAALNQIDDEVEPVPPRRAFRRAGHDARNAPLPDGVEAVIASMEALHASVKRYLAKRGVTTPRF